MATIVSLDAYRHRKAHPRQISARERAGLPELLRETPAPSCAVCGRPIVPPSDRHPQEAALFLAALRGQGFCLLCYDPF